MFNRKKLERERLEIYLTHLLLAYRILFLICGGILSIFSAAILRQAPLLGMMMLVVAVVLLLLGLSYQAVLRLAKLGAWAVVLLKSEDRSRLNGS